MNESLFELDLQITSSSTQPSPIPRRLSRADSPAMASLMFAAYEAGNEPPVRSLARYAAEMERVWDGVYGPLVENACLCWQVDDELVGCLLTCVEDGHPFILYLMVAPEHRGRGIASALVGGAIDSLRESQQRVRAVIRDGNLPSERVFRNHGFQRVRALNRE